MDVEPQAMLTPITEAAIFLTVVVAPGAEPHVREALPDISGLRRSVGFRIPAGALTCVVGIGADAWDRILGLPRPVGLHPFRSLAGARHHAPATAGDLFFHIRARRFDLCFELAQRLMERLDGHVSVVDEVHGFRSFDERDVLGFVDGTENPEGAAARAAVLIPADEDPPYAGGSYVVTQKYVHDLTAWDALPVEQQENVIGRTKLSDIEMPDDVKPVNSHVALNTIVDADGDELQIMRFNMPFGRVGTREFGTFFIGYAANPDVLERMLSNMFIGNPPGNYDRILDFSTPLTGGLFFVPALGFLDDPPDADAGVEPSHTTSHVATGDGSLGVGSLVDDGRRAWGVSPPA